MSHVNFSNKIYEKAEVNYDKCGEGYTRNVEGAIVASDILNDILETAMDIAINTSTDGVEAKKVNIIDEEYNDSYPEIRDIIDGLSKINIGNLVRSSPEQPATLDVEMKRLLSEMMSPPFEVVDYEALPRKDGVGDQPPAERDSAEETVVGKPSKVVEKKSRITDLVMNSKRALNNLLDEEERRRQEEWEEKNEHVVRVIELQEDKPRLQTIHSPDIPPENVPLPQDDDEADLLPRPNDEWMDAVELNATPKSGEGDDLKTEAVVKPDEKKTDLKKKKKKWGFNFNKFFAFKRNRSKTTNTDN